MVQAKREKQEGIDDSIPDEFVTGGEVERRPIDVEAVRRMIEKLIAQRREASKGD